MRITIIKKSLLIGMIVLLLALSTNYILASPQQWIVTSQQANAAFDYAMQYVDRNVAYLYGGRLTVNEYSQALADGKKPGIDIGVDSSAVVTNAYKSVLPDIRFWIDDNKTRALPDATSTSIFHFNSKHLSLEQAQKGDLLFFKNVAGNIMGVGMFSHKHGDIVHFLVASANAGKVILTNTHINGSYWKNHFAGLGRLQYALAD